MSEPILNRYAAIAKRVHALLRDPEPGSLDAPPGVRPLISLAVRRLGVFVSAMPGAQPPSTQEFDDARGLRESLEREAQIPR